MTTCPFCVQENTPFARVGEGRSIVNRIFGCGLSGMAVRERKQLVAAMPVPKPSQQRGWLQNSAVTGNG